MIIHPFFINMIDFSLNDKKFDKKKEKTILSQKVLELLKFKIKSASPESSERI